MDTSLHAEGKGTDANSSSDRVEIIALRARKGNHYDEYGRRHNRGCACRCHPRDYEGIEDEHSGPCCMCDQVSTTLKDEVTADYIIKDGKLTLRKEIAFQFNSAVLTQEGMLYVGRLAKLFRQYPHVKVFAKGYTDGEPGKDHLRSSKLRDATGEQIGGTNMQLSAWRAHAVTDRLVRPFFFPSSTPCMTYSCTKT